MVLLRIHARLVMAKFHGRAETDEIVEGFDGASARRSHCRVGEKREIVELMLLSPMPVPSLGRQHDVNANQVSYCLRLYRAG